MQWFRNIGPRKESEHLSASLGDFQPHHLFPAKRALSHSEVLGLPISEPLWGYDGKTNFIVYAVSQHHYWSHFQFFVFLLCLLSQLLFVHLHPHFQYFVTSASSFVFFIHIGLCSLKYIYSYFDVSMRHRDFLKYMFNIFLFNSVAVVGFRLAYKWTNPISWFFNTPDYPK